jgi:hypothetical protein
MSGCRSAARAGGTAPAGRRRGRAGRRRRLRHGCRCRWRRSARSVGAGPARRSGARAARAGWRGRCWGSAARCPAAARRGEPRGRQRARH